MDVLESGIKGLYIIQAFRRDSKLQRSDLELSINHISLLTGSLDIMSFKLNLKANILGSLLLYSGFGLSQSLNKPVLFSDGLSPHVDNVFFQYLTPTQSTWDEWAWGWIPQACLSIVQGTQFSPYDIEVYNVHYTDCGSAWVICRHHDAQMSVIDMIGNTSPSFRILISDECRFRCFRSRGST